MIKQHNYRRTVIVLGSAALGLLTLLLAACQARPAHLSGGAPAVLAQAGTVEEVVVITPSPTAASGTVEVGLDQEDCQCIDCHSDSERLKELAVEPEEVEALSEGEG